MNKEYIHLAVGLVIGATASYILTKNLEERKYERLIEEEIQSVKDHYESKHSEEADEPGLGEDLQDIVDDLGYSDDKMQEKLEALKVKARNGWQDPEEELYEGKVVVDMGFEPSPRDPNVPYVINIEEFTDDNEDYDKLSVTYYEGDDVMADERDGVIPEPSTLVGADALTRFGEGSDDENIVYVRNEKLTSDFEIVRDARSYASVVLGLEDDTVTEPGKFREYED